MDKHILKFWRDVELFNLPDFDKKKKDLILLKDNQSLPWARNQSPKQGYTFKYIISFGVIKKKDVVSAIERHLHDISDQDWIEPVSGETCMASLVLDKDGRPNTKSYTQASFLYGLIALAKQEPMLMAVEQLGMVQEDFEFRYNFKKNDVSDEPEESRKGTVVGQKDISDELSHIKALAQEAGLDVGDEVYCSVLELKEGFEIENPFLNSFYIDDLIKLQENNSMVGKALQEYLTARPTKRRMDLLTSREHFIKRLDPVSIPAGRWPSKVGNGLYSAQQAAVNRVFQKLKNDSGIMGINGPPGTGKTTLLLDIISEVIVDRATRLMKIDPSELFVSGYNKIDLEKSFAGYFEINENIMDGAGIVISSSNNAAVENITKELPSQRKIDLESFQDAAYFSAQASDLLKEPAWGILGAALGNGENRKEFLNNFWKSNDSRIGFSDLLKKAYENKDEPLTFVFVKMFNEAKVKLRKLLQEFNSFKETSGQIYSKREGYVTSLKRRQELKEEINQLKETIDDLNGELLTTSTKLEEIDKSLTLIQNTIVAHQKFKPLFFFFHKLFNTQKYQQWHVPMLNYQSELNSIFNERVLLAKVKTITIKRIDELTTKVGMLSSEFEAVSQRIYVYLKQIEKLREQYGILPENIVDQHFYEKSNEEIHKLAPYSSEKINKLRSEIFLTSLELQQWAIMANAKQFWNNLNFFFVMLSGKAQVSAKLSATLWNTFFFCVPVVSTTLASVARLFKFADSESIGWLLLDEAGQATPQSAAGIISRSKRCVIVGDPLQIEPVTNIPLKLVNSLLSQNKVSSEWSPLQASVQTLADRISEDGTFMENGGGDEPIWTGFPLRTHRRCNEPMFSIANQIAYSNQMVRAVEDAPFDCSLGESAWFHVAGTLVRDGQVIGEEIELLKQHVQKLNTSGQVNNVFVISPFKSVAKECRAALKNYPGISCGTIHTFQGKEADIVFLVLGSDPSKPKSREWASSKPNILNVAITRAKKRLYVIGNKNLWGACNYFNVLAADLKS